MDLWRCLEDARCTSSDERLQLAVIRDPRAVTVSGYFHSVKHTRGFQQAHPSVDQYFQQNLGFISRWTTVRYLLFTELLADRSHVVTFEDLMVDPVDWYGRFLHFIGLNLPSEVIFDIARVASEEGPKIYGRIRKGVDEHPGSIVPEGSRRTFRDELGQTSLEMMDDVMRPLLPPALLKRFGVDMQ